MDTRAFGNRLNKARKDIRISSEALGKLVSINASFIRQMEIGKKGPSIESLVALCNALKVSPDYLLTDYLDKYSKQEASAICERLTALNPSQLRLINVIIDQMEDENESRVAEIEINT